ncbi:hypothetical protein [Dyadobacter diqingensis]|uniref:hypothetical protein n=1 Tax=Dyadobacter diqingensis TaxID=2938121 RepID=UPI0020C2E841|nr:hypothetical protein [Dyadobacter diqingensis]
MENIQRVEISPSPGYPDVVRKIIIAGRNEDYLAKTVTLICRIEHYDQHNNRLNAFAAIERDPFLLVADDTSKVDPLTGALVFPDENGNYPIGATGQYTWLHAAVESGVNPFSIAQGAVLEADSYLRFT